MQELVPEELFVQAGKSDVNENDQERETGDATVEKKDSPRAPEASSSQNQRTS